MARGKLQRHNRHDFVLFPLPTKAVLRVHLSYAFRRFATHYACPVQITIREQTLDRSCSSNVVGVVRKIGVGVLHPCLRVLQQEMLEERRMPALH